MRPGGIAKRKPRPVRRRTRRSSSSPARSRPRRRTCDALGRGCEVTFGERQLLAPVVTTEVGCSPIIGTHCPGWRQQRSNSAPWLSESMPEQQVLHARRRGAGQCPLRGRRRTPYRTGECIRQFHRVFIYRLPGSCRTARQFQPHEQGSQFTRIQSAGLREGFHRQRVVRETAQQPSFVGRKLRWTVFPGMLPVPGRDPTSVRGQYRRRSSRLRFAVADQVVRPRRHAVRGASRYGHYRTVVAVGAMRRGDDPPLSGDSTTTQPAPSPGG